MGLFSRPQSGTRDTAFWKRAQSALAAKGFYHGVIDGDRGPKTNSAIIAYKKSIGLASRDYLGPLTEAALFGKSLNPAPVGGHAGEPCWLRRARQEIGVQEIPGSRHSAAVLGYWERAKLYFTSDEVPWCAGFVGAMLEDCGIRSTRSGMARSYCDWGRKLTKPVPGAVVVFWRGSRGGSSGHVGFVAGVDQNGNVRCLGGNQSDAVNVKSFSTDRVLGYYWPDGVPLPGDQALVVERSDGPLSSNEA